MIKAVLRNLNPLTQKDIETWKLKKAISNEKEKFEYLQEYESWEKCFIEFTSKKPWSLQSFWGKKLVLKRSFALLAPTGIGKTTFGLASALYFYKQNKKTYIILPTKLLVNQVYQRIKQLIPEKDIVCFVSNIPSSKKMEMKRKLLDNSFKVLISTSMFLYKNFSKIKRLFDFIFIDDVDSFLKSAKNIDKVLQLLGYDENDITLCLEYIKKLSLRNQSDLKQLKEYIEKIKHKRKGIIVVSSATSNPKSKRIKLFDLLLDFELGKPKFFLRNIEDIYEDCNDLKNRLVELIKKFGSGGLVFVSSDYKKEFVKQLKDFLISNNINAETYENLNEETIKKFKSSEIKVLIGISSYKNPLTRGLDLPETIRYAIFFGVPKIEINISIENEKLLILALTTIKSILSKDDQLKSLYKELDKILKKLRKIKNMQDNSKLSDTVKEEINALLKNPKLLEKLTKSEEISFNVVDNNIIIRIADITSYLQASGRTSRLFWKGLSKGLSYILIDDKRVFNDLIKKSRWWFSQDISFKNFRDINLDEILKKIDEDRTLMKKPISEKTDFFETVLMIVESPNKCRTIANFFGKPLKRRILNHEVYEVLTPTKYLVITSSLGHILDLSKEIGYYGVLENEEYIPVYEIIEGKENIVKALQELSKEFDKILIATDPDTEGEKIAWDLKNILMFFAKDIKRMEFHEITKRSILKAIEETREINENLVKAQILRRISDRWVGFEISQILQRKFNNNTLSAGRVQTPTLGWIIQKFFQSLKKKYLVVLKSDSLTISFEFQNITEAKKFYHSCNKLEVINWQEREEELSPLPPFSTDSILKESSKYKLSAMKTMQILQDLFEMGLITYHRTDSTRVSDAGISIAKEYISEIFGEEYFKPRTWESKGAHECIRPTKALDAEELKNMIYTEKIKNLTKDHILIYDLIFKRFICSQMRNARVKKILLSIDCEGIKKDVEIISEILQEGFNKLKKIPINPINKNQEIPIHEKRIYKIPLEKPYTQGSLIEEMKNKGIGRPSTYAITISKLLNRKYVFERNLFLFPTKLGILIYRYILQNIDKFQFLTEQFTRELEGFMDLVEEGKINFQDVLKNLRTQLKRIEVSEKGNLKVINE
ncbi:MAG: reverse gyrase [Candidatus Woesearchaeota archaeon]